MATKLTEDQLAEARRALAESEKADEKSLTDQILFEQRRDDLAYSIIQTAASEKPKRRLSFGEAQALATEQLGKAAAAALQPASEAAAVVDVAVEQVGQEEPAASGKRGKRSDS